MSSHYEDHLNNTISMLNAQLFQKEKLICEQIAELTAKSIRIIELEQLVLQLAKK